MLGHVKHITAEARKYAGTFTLDGKKYAGTFTVGPKPPEGPAPPVAVWREMPPPESGARCSW